MKKVKSIFIILLSVLVLALIFMVFLKLYNLQVIDLEAFQKGEDSNIGESNGEFDLAYCLKKIK